MPPASAGGILFCGGKLYRPDTEDARFAARTSGRKSMTPTFYAQAIRAKFNGFLHRIYLIFRACNFLFTNPR
jgi:hypothetical protein